jgi:hypothetical protein
MLLDFNIECHQSQLGALVGSKSFVESFVVEVLYKDLGLLFNLLIDFEAAFGMLLLGYAQHLNYLLCTMFPFPTIL